MADVKAARNALIVLLKARRSGMGAAERSRRKKPTRWLYPWATEHRYAQSYRAWVKPVREYVYGYIERHSVAVLRGDGAGAVIRRDVAAGESFALMVRSLNGWADAYISDDGEKKLRSPIYMGLGDIAESAFGFNGTQYDKSCKSSVGVEFPSDESWWAGARMLWQDTNYDIIRSDIKKYIADINTATEQAVTNGWSVKALAGKIQALDAKITRSRANFIARDQIGKLNGTITQRRMQDIGLTMYEWSSSSDERVRESHAVMDGKLCRWDDATVYSEDGGNTWKPRPIGAVLMHPGMDYQCRCTALAWFDELIDEADGVETPVSIREPSTSAEPPKATAAAPVSLPSDFVPAKSIKEANEYAMKVLGIPHADYKGVDLAAANEWNKGLAENFKKFPELKERFGFVGECHARNTAIREKFFAERRHYWEKLAEEQFPNATAEQKRNAVDSALKKDWRRISRYIQVSHKTLAESFSTSSLFYKEFNGITMNKDGLRDYSAYKKIKENDVAAKFHPVGTASLKGDLDHEIGHQIDSLLDLRHDSVILDLWASLSDNEKTDGLSRYSWDNGAKEKIAEFIAEGWSEYCNNPNPRPIAKKIGERAEELYKGVKKQ